MSKKKICFVIAPIGEEGSETRKRSDQVFKHVISPVANSKGYQAEMAHHLSEPGQITTQIIDRILNAELVVADLTGNNPNVLYELAVRHVVRKPVVQIIQKGERLPFDIAQQRTISLDHKDLDSVEQAKGELTKQIESVEKDPSQVDSPITVAINMNSLKGSEKPIDTALVEIMSMLQEMRSEQQNLTQLTRAFLVSPDSAGRTRSPVKPLVGADALLPPKYRVEHVNDRDLVSSYSEEALLENLSTVMKQLSAVKEGTTQTKDEKWTIRERSSP